MKRYVKVLLVTAGGGALQAVLNTDGHYGNAAIGGALTGIAALFLRRPQDDKPAWPSPQDKPKH